MYRCDKRISLVASLALILAFICIFPAQNISAANLLVNGGFETGDLTGWNASVPPGGSAQVVDVFTITTADNNTATYNPIEGQYFALLRNGLADQYTMVSQPFLADKGVVISGWAFFKTTDYLPYNDTGSVEVTINAGPELIATVFSASVSTVGNYGGTPWTHWSYTFYSRGNYTVQARVVNLLDSSVPSYLGLDDVSLEYVPSANAEQPTSSPPMSYGSSALIVVKNMNVSPQQAYAGQPITIAANIANDGDQPGGYTASLKIDGRIEQTKVGAVDGHSAIPVSFIVSRSEPGTYAFDIGGQNGTFVVLADKPASPQPSTGGIIAIVIAFLMLASVAVVLTLTFRRP